MTALSLLRFLLVGCVGAIASTGQESASEIELPKVSALGVVPENLPQVRLDASGAVVGDEGLRGKREVAAFVVDRRCSVAAVGKAVRLFRAFAHRKAVVFVARTRKGDDGGFLLTFGDDLGHNLDLTLHYGRPGVHPDSLRPHLRRIRVGRSDVQAPVAPRVRAPGHMAFGTLLQVLVSARQSGFESMVVDWGGPSPKTVSSRMPAMDLGPVPSFAVLTTVVRPDPKNRHDGTWGFATAPEKVVTARVDEGAGGVYGMRGRMPKTGGSLQPFLTAIENGRGQIDVGSTNGTRAAADAHLRSVALAALSVAGGNGLLSGRNDESLLLRAAVGRLLEAQQPDGRIGNTVRVHAIATYALAEASGLSADGWARGHARDAVNWLIAAGDPRTGAFGEAGQKPDTRTTAWALCALRVAGFFRTVGSSPELDDAIEWLIAQQDPQTGRFGLRDPKDLGSPEDQLERSAIAAFALALCGDDQSMALAAKFLVDAHKAKPETFTPLARYGTTLTIYQLGGRSWRDWSTGLRAEVLAESRAAAEPKGDADLEAVALRIMTAQVYWRYSRLIR